MKGGAVYLTKVDEVTKAEIEEAERKIMARLRRKQAGRKAYYDHKRRVAEEKRALFGIK